MSHVRGQLTGVTSLPIRPLRTRSVHRFVREPYHGLTRHEAGPDKVLWWWIQVEAYYTSFLSRTCGVNAVVRNMLIDLAVCDRTLEYSS